MNRASREMLLELEDLLPCSVDEMVGQSIDLSTHRQSINGALLSDPDNLPHHAQIPLGDQILDLNAVALYDDDGLFVGRWSHWDVVTEQRRQQMDTAGQIAAINTSQAVIEFEMDGTIITGKRQLFLECDGIHAWKKLWASIISMFVDRRRPGRARNTGTFWERLNRGEYEAGEYKPRWARGERRSGFRASYNPILDRQWQAVEGRQIRGRTSPEQKLAAAPKSAGQIEAIGKSQAGD